MGCAPSGISGKGGLRLMATKITFSKDQLDNLNDYFSKSVAKSIQENADAKTIEATVERLVQRLLVGVGNIDQRFSSMFLISLNDRSRIKQFKFEYLVRIDALSSPGLTSDQEAPVSVEEDAAMPGFARVRIRGSEALQSWGEFLGPGGRLRRDLIKSKLANLLASAIKPGSTNGADERLCWTPGQVVDAEVLEKILKRPDHCRIFYGPAYSEAVLPEPRDHRVALVEDATGILLRIGLAGGSKGREAEVRLLIGVGVSSWSALADYPRRVPLHHCDALLHLTSAQSGMYVVAVGPYPGARCEDRATLWRVRFPAAEIIMQHHYHEDSVPALTDTVLSEILDQLRGRRRMKLPFKNKDTMRVVSRHILKTIHWWSLERAGPDPLRSWAPGSLSRHVLMALDELVTALKCQSLRCYYYPRCNVMLQCAKGGILHHEDSYLSDSRLLESYLTTLYNHSLNDVPVDLEPSDILENELITRWRRVITSLPRGTMGRHCGYSGKQLEYLSLVVKEVLKVKKAVLQGGDDASFLNFPTPSHSSEPTENLVYLLTLILRQARDQIYAATDRRNRKQARRKRLRRRAKNSATAYFERSVDVLVDIVRRDRETAYVDLENNLVLAKTLVKWLYFGMEHDRKTLGPILRPYLGNLFNSSHENAWHVESWRKREEIFNTEMRSLSLFCKLVTTQEVSPANGVVDSLSKGWTWAENVTKMIERSENGLKLVFVTEKVARYNLTFANNKGLNMYSTWSKARNVSNAVKRTTIARTNMITISNLLPSTNLTTNCDADKEFAGHVVLREASPLTSVVSMGRRRGRQRGPGGLVPALVALNKFRILQEVAAVLPHDERIAMLDAVQRVAREASRRSRRASCPDTAISGSPRQTYTPRSESYLDLPPSPPLSPTTRQRSIIAEHQRQLHREMLEMHDTMTRGLRPRGQLPAWDSASLASWTSSIGSMGRNRMRIHRIPTWDGVRGPSPIWDSVSTDGSFGKSRSEEMISREDSPKWNTLERQHSHNATTDFGERPRLPSWDCLEANLDQKFSKYDVLVEPDSLEVNRDVGIDYLLAANASREFQEDKSPAGHKHRMQWKTPILKQTTDMALKLTLSKEIPPTQVKRGESSSKNHEEKTHRIYSRSRGRDEETPMIVEN